MECEFALLAVSPPADAPGEYCVCDPARNLCLLLAGGEKTHILLFSFGVVEPSEHLRGGEKRVDRQVPLLSCEEALVFVD